MSTPNEYQMIHRLGSGPAGPVYVSRSASGLAALRQFVSRAAPHSTVWLQERQRFLEAGQRGEGLKHPHIVPVREVIDEGENAFVVMEYVTSGAVDGAKVPPPAGTLDQALSARAFSEPEILTLLGEIAAALDYAHKQGVVHGDLKPKDVFLIDGQGAKVADFAISPRAALIPGTPVPTRWSHPYLSPEHLSGARVGRKADQYSLAVIAYQMYTGKLPGGRPDSPGPGPAPASDSAATLATLPARVTAALDQALNRDPDRRFSSCQEFVSALSGRTHRGRYVLLGLVALAALGWFALSRSPRPVGPVAGKVSTAVVRPPTLSPPPVEAPKPEVPIAKPGPFGKAVSNPVDRSGQKTAPAVAAPKSVDKPEPAPPPEPIVVPVKPGRTGKGQRQQPVAAALGAPQLPPVTPVERERDGSAVRRPPLSNEVGIAGSSPSGFTLSALSRGNRITEGSSFPANDTVLGELGDGDLKILVQLDGGRVPRGKLSVEWYLNGVRMDRRPAVLNQVVEYGNQPTPGTYEVLLKLNERAVQRFTFRITP